MMMFVVRGGSGTEWTQTSVGAKDNLKTRKRSFKNSAKRMNVFAEKRKSDWRSSNARRSD